MAKHKLTLEELKARAKEHAELSAALKKEYPLAPPIVVPPPTPAPGNKG